VAGGRPEDIEELAEEDRDRARQLLTPYDAPDEVEAAIARVERRANHA
jgi:hypothetical protein